MVERLDQPNPCALQAQPPPFDHVTWQEDEKRNMIEIDPTGKRWQRFLWIFATAQEVHDALARTWLRECKAADEMDGISSVWCVLRPGEDALPFVQRDNIARAIVYEFNKKDPGRLM